MEIYDVRPKDGIGPFHLGMTRDEAEALRSRQFPGRDPDTCSRMEYLNGRLAGISLYKDEDWKITYRGLDLNRIHVEELLPVLKREAMFECDCEDPELACTYWFPTLGLNLWRESCYHPKLLGNPCFQALIHALPENLEYEQEHGWYFLSVSVQWEDLRANIPLEVSPAPYSRPLKSVPSYRKVTAEESEKIAKKYGLKPPEGHGGGV